MGSQVDSSPQATAYREILEEVKASVAISDAELAEHPKPEHQRSRWTSLSKQLITTLHPNPVWASISVGLENANVASGAAVWQLTPLELDRFIKQGRSFDRPILIRSKPVKPAARYNDFLEALRKYEYVDVQDLSRTPRRVVCRKPTSEVVKRIKRGIPSLVNSKDLPLNLLNMEDIAHHHPDVVPRFLKHPRFQLLREIAARLRDRLPTGGPYSRNPGKRDFIEACAEFSIFAQRGAFSGPHCDALVGTWVYNIRGIKAWPIIPNMTEAEVLTYECEGSFWQPPPESVKMLLLQEGDTFIMPAGLSVIHCPLTVTDCYMVGGMFWDDKRILDILHGILWTARAPMITNESLSRQMPEVISLLRKMIVADPDRFRGTATASEFLSQFDTLFELIVYEGSCDCCEGSPSGCKCVKSTCKCKVWRENCNDWCRRRRKTIKKEESPMQPLDTLQETSTTVVAVTEQAVAPSSPDDTICLPLLRAPQPSADLEEPVSQSSIGAPTKPEISATHGIQDQPDTNTQEQIIPPPHSPIHWNLPLHPLSDDPLDLDMQSLSSLRTNTPSLTEPFPFSSHHLETSRAASPEASPEVEADPDRQPSSVPTLDTDTDELANTPFSDPPTPPSAFQSPAETAKLRTIMRQMRDQERQASLSADPPSKKLRM